MTPTTRRTARPFDDRDQEERAHRARVQAGDYTLHNQDGRFILEKENGNAYVVTATECSCEDWLYRVSKVEGARCKHQAMVGNWMIEQGLEFISPTARADVHGVQCGRCKEEMTPSDMRNLPEPGEIVCGMCQTADGFDPFPDEEPGPAGPEDLASGERITITRRESTFQHVRLTPEQEAATLARLFGGA